MSAPGAESWAWLLRFLTHRATHVGTSKDTMRGMPPRIPGVDPRIGPRTSFGDPLK